jgi:hypothetical protein
MKSKKIPVTILVCVLLFFIGFFGMKFIFPSSASGDGNNSYKETDKDKNIELKDEYDESKMSVYYNPHKECLCYTFDIEGAVDGKWDDELCIFVFTPIINVNDISDIEIASTLGY